MPACLPVRWRLAAPFPHTHATAILSNQGGGRGGAQQTLSSTTPLLPRAPRDREVLDAPLGVVVVVLLLLLLLLPSYY